ncbi:MULTISPECIES: hypothetical protein [unclassified Pseudonocardia]|uniref:hypothetical protein n=1 Tax=unclassified Pseudonocardia TaxID=2619320 RepID=UPI001CF675ED|nr:MULTISPECIES: hypothetical protein [unclassified Pseudonocardia]
MRPLAVVLGVFGAFLGLLCTMLAPSLSYEVVSYGPTRSDSAYESVLSLSRDWSPALLIMPAVGLVSGIVVAVALGRAGWALRRD